ncbi:MAG TPA: Crp/Fnr family transcriptional regulator [Parafilimonas sp.]|nr:Crp/Fnr family transcriptional regulator [Parafilimonas sp.]
MFEVLLAYFGRNFTLTAEDIALMKSLFIPKTILKGEFILREGEIPKYGAFVCKGFLRSYFIDNKGKEHIIQFAPENWWISAKPDGAQQTPSAVFIDAIEDAEVLLIDRVGHITLMEKIPGYAASFLSGIQKRGEAKEKRIVHSLAATAEERYNDFLETYPNIVQRVPQHMLASYLGITPETVSRIRRKAMSKK